MKTLSVRTSALAAAGVSAMASAFELIRVIVTGGAAHGATAVGMFIGAIAFSLVLGITAVGLVMHRQWGWVAGVASIVAALAHGAVLRAGGNTIGIAYVLLSVLLFVLVVKSLPYYVTESTA